MAIGVLGILIGLYLLDPFIILFGVLFVLFSWYESKEYKPKSISVKEF